MKNLEHRLKKIKGLASGSKIKGIGGRYSYINVESVIDFLNLGLKMPQIAEIYGCCESTLRYQIKKDHPNFDARKYVELGKAEIKDEQIKKLYEKLGSTTKISGFLDLTPSGVRYRLHKMGIKPTKLRQDISVREVVELYNKYKRVSKVALELGVCEDVVRKRLDMARVKRDDSWKELMKRNDLPEQEIIDKYNDNGAIKRLAKEYKTSLRVIKRILLKNNVRIRSSYEWEARKDITPKMVAIAYKKLKKITAVARELKTSHNVVYNRLEKAGINYKKRKK